MGFNKDDRKEDQWVVRSKGHRQSRAGIQQTPRR
jgi:hypothetical protein